MSTVNERLAQSHSTLYLSETKINPRSNRRRNLEESPRDRLLFFCPWLHIFSAQNWIKLEMDLCNIIFTFLNSTVCKFFQHTLVFDLKTKFKFTNIFDNKFAREQNQRDACARRKHELAIPPLRFRRRRKTIDPYDKWNECYHRRRAQRAS